MSPHSNKIAIWCLLLASVTDLKPIQPKLIFIFANGGGYKIVGFFVCLSVSNINEICERISMKVIGYVRHDIETIDDIVGVPNHHLDPVFL